MARKVEVEIRENPADPTGIIVACTRCKNEVAARGNGEKSVRYGCAKLCETCLNDEENFYDPDDDE